MPNSVPNSVKNVKDAMNGNSLFSLQPQLLLAIMDLLVDISEKLDIKDSLKDNGIVSQKKCQSRK